MFILPINKENPVKRMPWIVFGLIAVNTLILVACYSGPGLDSTFHQYGFIPADHRTATLFTSMFLHGGVWHLVGNMWFLWMFGNRVENMFGRYLFPVAYVICGLGGHALHYFFNSSSTIPCVGASGAISGIAGIFFVLFPKANFDLSIYFGWWHVKTIPTHTHAAVGTWVIEQGLLGLLTQSLRVSSIGFWAHVGGFLAGVAIATLFVAVVPRETRLMAEMTKSWDQQDSFQHDDTITQLKL